MPVVLFDVALNRVLLSLARYAVGNNQLSIFDLVEKRGAEADKGKRELGRFEINVRVRKIK